MNWRNSINILSSDWTSPDQNVYTSRSTCLLRSLCGLYVRLLHHELVLLYLLVTDNFCTRLVIFIQTCLYKSISSMNNEWQKIFVNKTEIILTKNDVRRTSTNNFISAGRSSIMWKRIWNWEIFVLMIIFFVI